MIWKISISLYSICFLTLISFKLLIASKIIWRKIRINLLSKIMGLPMPHEQSLTSLSCSILSGLSIGNESIRFIYWLLLLFFRTKSNKYDRSFWSISDGWIRYMSRIFKLILIIGANIWFIIISFGWKRVKIII